MSDAHLHVTGSAQFVDDQDRPENMLFAAVLPAPINHGRIRSVDVEPARTAPGVVAVLLAADVKGLNQFGTIVADETVLAAEIVEYMGQPLALVVAESLRQAHNAVEKIKVDLEPLPAVTDPLQAFNQGMILGTPRTFVLGDVEAAWPQCRLIVQGRCDIGGQEHVYLETQRSRAVPLEGGRMRVFSSTQAPSLVQRALARLLGLPQHDVEVDVRRLGGGFGGKEDQATLWACLAALAAQHTLRPVELVLSRSEDMRMTGKRHPYVAFYKMGLSADGVILAYEVSFYQNAGCTTDLSPAILERTLFHCTNAYYVANVHAFAVSCKTHLPSNTAFRGFGGPQAMFVIEAAICEAAEKLSMPTEAIQKKNLLQDGDVFPYGQQATEIPLSACWQKAEADFAWQSWKERVSDYNQKQCRYKKGLAVMPICFGISFTNTLLNQSSALVHVYLDGSVAITIGGVEMGQGLNAKVARIAARALAIDERRIRLESANTSRVANSSPTAASVSTDLYGFAVLQAVATLQDRLTTLCTKTAEVKKEDITFKDERIWVAGRPTEWTWEKLIQAAYAARIPLSSLGVYATPTIHFDKVKEKGLPFIYHVCGVAMIEVTVDGLLGVYEIDCIKIVHELGTSLNPEIDRGQMEGGLVQGLGWMTLEEVVYNQQGRLLSDSLSTYKVPDVHFGPKDIEIQFTDFTPASAGPYRSKAVGEPPFMYGIGVYFALRQAIRAFNATFAFPFVTPLTPERVLMQLYHKDLATLLAP